MSDTTDSTEQMHTVPGTDGCAPFVDDGKDVTLLMHKGTVQEVASNKDGTMSNPESNKNPVFKCALQLMKHSISLAAIKLARTAPVFMGASP